MAGEQVPLKGCVSAQGRGGGVCGMWQGGQWRGCCRNSTQWCPKGGHLSTFSPEASTFLGRSV